MRIGADIAALGSMQQQKRLDVIANNIANVDSPGFKKDNVLFSDFVYQTTQTQMDQGTVRTTGDPLNIALVGEGFLRVQTPEGVRYTRAGNLTLNRDNTIVTQDGYPVLGQGGPIAVPDSENRGQIRIESNGQIYDGNDDIGKLDIVQFPKESRLEKTGNSYFKPVKEDDAPAPAVDCVVQQGALETANFTVVEEMTRMIDTLRVFEAYQRTMQAHHQEDTQLINKLGS